MSPDHRSTDGAAMPEVMGALTAAVARRAAPTGRRRRWLGRVAGLGLIAVVGSGTALATTGQWNPFDGRHRGDYTLAPAPVADTATLGVLRRPQDVQDQGPLMTAFVRMIAREGSERLGRGSRQIYLRYVRYLRPAGYSEMAGYDGALHVRTLPGALILIPARFHVPGLSQREQGGAAATHDDLCVDTIADNWPAGGPQPLAVGMARSMGQHVPIPTRAPLLEDRVVGGGTCVSLHELRMNGVVSGVYNYGALTGVVPDGVASVRATTRAGQVITDRVVNNSFELLAPGHDDRVRTVMPDGQVRTDMPALAGQFRHQSLQWLAADGHVLRTMAQ